METLEVLLSKFLNFGKSMSWNLDWIKWYGNLCMLPVNIRVTEDWYGSKTPRITLETSGLRHGLYLVQDVLYHLAGGVVIGAILVTMLFWREKFQMSHITLHVVICLVLWVSLLARYKIFCHGSPFYLLITEMMKLVPQVEGEYFQSLLLVGTPLLFVSFSALFSVLFFFDTALVFHPANWAGSSPLATTVVQGLLILLAFHMFRMMQIGGLVILSAATMLETGYHKMARQLDLGAKNERCEDIPDQVRKCRRMQLVMMLYNDVAAAGSYGIKSTCLTSGILCATMVICKISDDALFLVFHGYFAIVCVVAYPLLFRKAFEFPDLIRGVKRKMTLRAMRSSSAMERRLLLQQVQSVPEWGMKDGSFKEFEQGTLLIFLDFFVGNLVSAVITLKTV